MANKNYLSLELGGKKRGLKFNLGTLRHIGEITNGDPMDFAITFENTAQIFRFVHTIVFAGLLSNCDVKDEEPDFDAKRVEKWINDWDLKQAMDVITAFNNAYALSGEESRDTQGKAA